MSTALALLRVENSRHTATTASNPLTALIQSTGAGKVVGQPPMEAIVVATATSARASPSIPQAVRQVRLWSRPFKNNPAANAPSATAVVTALARNGAAIVTGTPTATETTTATERAIRRPLR